jgi:hypothetical protein
LATTCKRCDPATPWLELGEEDGEYDFGTSSDVDEDEYYGGGRGRRATSAAGATAKSSLLGGGSAAVVAERGERGDGRGEGRGSTRARARAPPSAEQMAAVRTWCKCLFSCCWLLSLVLVALGTLASAATFPAAAALNDACNVADGAVENITALGLLPHLAESAAGSCFGNASLLDALGLADKLDFAGSMGELLSYIDDADIAAQFAAPQAMARNLSMTIEAFAAGSSIPGFYAFNATRFVERATALDALATCVLPAECPLPDDSPCPTAVPVPCAYGSNTAVFTRANVATEPWLALNDAAPGGGVTPAQYVSGAFADESSPAMIQWSAAVIGAWSVTAADAEAADAIDVLLDNMQQNASAVSVAVDDFALALAGVQASLATIAATSLTAFADDATAFTTAARCDFVRDSYATLHVDVCDSLLLDAFVLSLCTLLVVLAMLPLAALGPSFDARFSTNRALRKVRAFTSTTIERATRALSSSRSRAGSEWTRPSASSYIAMGSSGTFVRSRGGGAGVSSPSTREVVAHFYARYNAAKLDEVDALVRHYNGDVDALYADMRNKYGADPRAVFREQAQTLAQPPSTHAVVEAYYLRFNATKVGEVASIVSKFRGDERALYASLARKYGAEPLDVYAAAMAAGGGGGAGDGEIFGVQVQRPPLGLAVKQNAVSGEICVERLATGSALHGAVCVGDQLLSASGTSFAGCSMDRAVQILRSLEYPAALRFQRQARRID